MDQETKTKLEELSTKVDAIYASVEKSRKYFLVTMWITVLMIVLPMIGLAFVGPSFVTSYTSILNQAQ